MVSSPYDAPSTPSLTWSIFLAGRNCKTAYLGCWKLRASFTPHPFFEESSNCYILTLVTEIGKLQLHSHQTLMSYRRTCSQRDLWGDFSVVQWLRICFAKKEKKICLMRQGLWVPSLVGELRSHVQLSLCAAIESPTTARKDLQLRLRSDAAK